MEEQVILVFEDIGLFAILLSIALNILISVLGVVPSIFLTAANISFFGFGYGLLISIIGEALGAIVSFALYRLGLNRVQSKVFIQNPYIEKLKQTGGITAFILVLSLRLAPFIPSGVITLVSAGSRMGILSFSLASTLGKFPALLLEAFSVQAIMQWEWQGQFILGGLSISILIYLFRKRKQSS